MVLNKIPLNEIADTVRFVANWVRASGPLRIIGYRSFAANGTARVKGRALTTPPAGQAQPGEHGLRAAGRMAGRFMTREVEGLTVEVDLDGKTEVAVTDNEGYFSVDLPLAFDPGASASWVDATVRIIKAPESLELDVSEHSERRWPVDILVVGSQVDRIYISDVDDTVLSNAGGDGARTVLTTLAGSELTRRPIPGAPRLYRQLSNPTDHSIARPFFYVSSSPWNLYDFLVSFFSHNDFPPGPLLLRDVGLNRKTFADQSHYSHKVSSITEILDLISHPNVVLIGDSSLQDAAAFGEIADLYPDRVVASYLRDIGHDHKSIITRQVIDARPNGAPPMKLVAAMNEISNHLNTFSS